MGSIAKELKISKIEKSYKFEGYCFVTLTTKIGYAYKRKCYERKTGPFKGKILINLDCDIYSFVWGSDNNAKEITWVGNYKSLEDAEKAIKPLVEVDEEKVIDEVIIDTSMEVFHEKYGTILTCVKENIPVYLAGPAGSGKNHTLEQVAAALDLQFFFTNSIQQEYKLTGFIDAGGKFHETEFFRAFTQGGLFFLDEMDASIPEVLVLLNAAIANRYFEFPTGKVTAHEDFRVVAAGNTVGSGADEKYTGRLVLDQATLDRFVIIHFDYDKKIELHLAKGNVELVEFIEKLRERADKANMRTTFSYRCISMVAKLEKAGMKLVDIMVIAVVKGMDIDSVNTLKALGLETNKYARALQLVNKVA